MDTGYFIAEHALIYFSLPTAYNAEVGQAPEVIE
jgi:hypothetical protein